MVNSYTSLAEKAMLHFAFTPIISWNPPLLCEIDRSSINIPISIFCSYEWPTKNEEIFCSRV